MGKAVNEKKEGELTRATDALLKKCSCKIFSLTGAAMQKKGMPDRLYAHPLLKRGATFVEWKRESYEPTINQITILRRYCDAGFPAVIGRFAQTYAVNPGLRIGPAGSIIRFEAWGGRILNEINMLRHWKEPEGRRGWLLLRALRIAEERLVDLGLLRDLDAFMAPLLRDDGELRKVVSHEESEVKDSEPDYEQNPDESWDSRDTLTKKEPVDESEQQRYLFDEDEDSERPGAQDGYFTEHDGEEDEEDSA